MYLDRMMEQVVDEYYMLMEAKQMEVSIESGSGLALFADNEKIARVMRDLLRNLKSWGRESDDPYPDAGVWTSAMRCLWRWNQTSLSISDCSYLSQLLPAGGCAWRGQPACSGAGDCQTDHGYAEGDTAGKLDRQAVKLYSSDSKGFCTGT